MSLPFANGANPAHATPVHGFPLPPEGRDYRPTYSGGRYVLPDPVSGVSNRFTRVTSGARTLEETAGLDRWKMGNVVLGLKERPDLLDGVDLYADPQDVTRQVRRIADKASEIAGANHAAELGTAIHAWTEAVERDGLEVDKVPTQFRPYVRAYLDQLSQWGITTVPGMVERIIYHSGTGWVGTFDRIYQLADGTRVIGDVKTSKRLDYSYLSFATQLATYANADYMLSLDGKRWEPMPPVGNVYAVIAHVPSNQPGKCELVTIDLEAGAYALDLAVAVTSARSGARSAIADRWELPAPHAPQPGPSLAEQVDSATSTEQLSALYEAHASEWSEDLTQRGYARLSSLGLV